MSTETEIRQKYSKLTQELIKRKLMITTMESATSGLIASLITDTEGSSAILKGAFITYSNEAKIRQGVPKEIIETYGVYSRETAREMAFACKKFYQADIGIGVTGTLGNVDPNNKDSVPGEVYFGIAYGEECVVFFQRLEECGTRREYKLQIAELVVKELGNLLHF